MSRLRKGVYTGVDERQVRQALEQLEKGFDLKAIPAQRRNESYFDTFDGALYAAGYLLRKRGMKLFLTDLDDEPIAGGPAVKANHFFAWEISAPELREVLRPAAGIRALSRVCSRRISREVVQLRNDDGKMVARVVYRYGSAAAEKREAALQPLVRIEEIRGYESAFEKASQLLQAAGLSGPVEGRNSLNHILDALELPSLFSSSKYTLALDKDILLGQAVAEIGCCLLAAMEVNHQGVIEDRDTEFLHDFRIAVRRTRSLLSQMKKYLPEAQLAFFQNEFKWLGSVTGPVRDLDVYLLMKEDYAGMLPPQLHRGLEEFFVTLESRRTGSMEAMRKALKSERYAGLTEEWRHFLENDRQGWPGAERRCQPIARKAICRRFEKIMQNGLKIDVHSGDDDLHRLRIQGKKLKYMLEFFRSFYVPEEIDFFHGQLKKLQNNLGDFNDISVQLQMLEEHAGFLPTGTRRSLRIGGAIGGLITHLSGKHAKVRRKFEKTFAAFASAENQERFQKLFV